jgi:hypothetical protein
MRALVLVVGLAAAWMGCKQEAVEPAAGSGGAAQVATTGGQASADQAAKGLFTGFDPKAELAALQGTWQVKDDAFAKEPSVWKISADQLTITKGDKTKQGSLEIEYPGELAFVEKSGGGTSRSFYAYARDGAEVYIGLGTAGVKKGETYMVSDDGVIVMQPGSCNYLKKKMFGGWEEPVRVECSMQNNGVREVFNYHIPDRFQKGELKSRTVEAVGEALLNDQMKGHKAVKVQ